MNIAVSTSGTIPIPVVAWSSLVSSNEGVVDSSVGVDEGVADARDKSVSKSAVLPSEEPICGMG